MLLLISFLFFLASLIFNKEPQMLTEVKERYWAILDMLRASGDPMWEPVLKPSIITGIYGKKDGVIGFIQSI